MVKFLGWTIVVLLVAVGILFGYAAIIGSNNFNTANAKFVFYTGGVNMKDIHSLPEQDVEGITNPSEDEIRTVAAPEEQIRAKKES